MEMEKNSQPRSSEPKKEIQRLERIVAKSTPTILLQSLKKHRQGVVMFRLYPSSCVDIDW
jgi:hypothetical protein